MVNLRTGLLSAALAFGLVAPAFSETLQSALTAAYDNSNLLEQNRALLRAQNEDVAIALSRLRPQIGASSTIQHSDQATGLDKSRLGSSVTLSLELLVYDAGATKLAVAATEQAVKAVEQQLVQQEQGVLFNAVQAYLAVTRDARVVSLRQSNLRLITQELRAAQDRFEVGEVTRTDVAQAEARLAEARGSLAEAQGNLVISQELYRVAVGRAPGALTGIRSLPQLPGSLASAIAMAERESPAIRQAQFEIAVDELNVQRAKANTKPTISLSARAGHDRTNDNNSAIGLTMNVPIYQGGQLTALRRQAIAQAHASRANLNQQVILARQSVSDAWSGLAVARAQLRSSDRQIRAAQVAFDGVREEAKLGSRTTLDVLNAEQSLLDARTNRVVFETQVFAAAYEVLQATGTLTAEKLGLPVVRYDPSEYYNAVKSAPIPASKQGKKLDRILKRYQKN